jgi:hypothetical protein
MSEKGGKTRTTVTTIETHEVWIIAIGPSTDEVTSVPPPSRSDGPSKPTLETESEQS